MVFQTSHTPSKPNRPLSIYQSLLMYEIFMLIRENLNKRGC